MKTNYYCYHYNYTDTNKIVWRLVEFDRQAAAHPIKVNKRLIIHLMIYTIAIKWQLDRANYGKLKTFPYAFGPADEHRRQRSEVFETSCIPCTMTCYSML